MNKLVLLSVVVGSNMFAGIHSDTDASKNQSYATKYSWVTDSTDDNYKADAGRRRGKGSRGRRRGGNGLR